MEEIEIIIFDKEDLTKTLIESYVKELTFSSVLQKYDEFSPELINNNGLYKILIININNVDSDIFEKVEPLHNNKNIKIIAMSYDGSADLQVKSFRAGAKDFLIKPLIKADFINSLQAIHRKYFYRTNTSGKSRIFTAISNRKGDGKSGFLINLAKEVADLSDGKVLLLDFNNAQDNISFLLNANIIHNTNYYINNLTQDNAEAILSTVTRYKDSNLYIMANSFIKNKSIAINKEKLNDALNILKHHYRYIFIDKTPNEYSIEDDILINFSDEIFCIVLPFVSSFGKIKNALDNYFKNKNVKIILNQYTKEDDSKIEQIQTSLGREIFWKIPKNYSVANIAINNNITLKEAAEDTDIANTYRELAKSIVNRD